ncbi:bifunctional metallophosphatase/5'-nucleotidase [Weissella bombi]|uniref:2',3'-cyclic-nucleotide 2'-phosphodiesterase/5'-or 3'-nucleotidase, 5'-nucleotidase family n=1 Tax=Weissella bombi TaxID=1505725 RepID=A0A1C4ANB4_9LACO|nr:bifunctional UDP-sugar hydrolase/5'-nucleotidase [Weissella bombi]SCB96125.1 2',3'-cyclic-nucleotide 2'-phosphodiesterase/5'-or 3'-nucleotidase, 5'-nucleotidase family [Weissella bombi]
MSDKISILHTNDLHSHLERWPKIRRYLLTRKRQLIRDKRSVLMFDIGDFIDRQHPLTEATNGQANINLMNEIGYDGVTIGNNEGLGLNHEQLNHLYDHANFSVILGNMTDKQTQEQPDWALPYKIITTPKGTRIGVLGFTAPFELTYPLLGWQPEDVDHALARLLPQLAGKTDINVLLSHLGLQMDRYLAERYSELQVIIGAHTHHLLAYGEKHANSMLAAAGRYGDHIGRIDLEVQDGKLLNIQARTLTTDDLPAVRNDEVEINGYQASGEEQLTKNVVAYLPEDYHIDLNFDHRLIDLGLAALEERTQTDIAMLSTGMFLHDLPAGVVTANDLHALLPHAVHPMRSILKGADLWRLVQEVIKNQRFLQSAHVKGMGFRGNLWGTVVWDGIEVTDAGDVLVHNQPIDYEAHYTIGALDHYYFIPYFPTFEIMGQNTMSYDTVLREDFANYLHKKFAP